MAIAAPKVQIILDYESFFGVKPPENRISIINDISKEHILFELVALNYRLKPKEAIYIDTSFETQVKELKRFTMEDKELFIKYSTVANKHTKSKSDYPLIFNRQACLFAIEEIINSSEIRTIENFVMARVEVWEAILKYLLAVNCMITQIKEEKDENKISFEVLNPKLIPLNELSIETDQIYTPYRGHRLIDYFLNSPEYTNEINQYFQTKYGIEPHHFIYHIMAMYFANAHDNPEHNFFYRLSEKQGVFDVLSERTSNAEIYKLLSIRKSPFINVDELKYLISDNSFLLEKAYSQLINDFWFDWIKHIKGDNGGNKFNINQYRGVFGLFFEKYLAQIFAKCFENYKYSTLLMFDQLKIKTPKGTVELADIYFRYGNKILVGQVKSGSIYDVEKYGGDIESLYKRDRNKFFENFGVNQIVESLTNIDNNIQELDPKFPKGHTYEFFPCIIVNDKAFQTPLMPDVFNIRFQELLAGFNIKKVTVRPLSLIHVSDLERLEEPLNAKPKQIWDLFKYHYRDKKFMPPFYSTINHECPRRQYPNRIKDLFRQLVAKYNANESESGTLSP